MFSDSSTSLAPGFRFHPTDEELVSYYLRRKVSGKPFRFDPISVIDIYKSEPWDLPCQSKLRSKDLEWYFFSALDKKYGNGSRTNRATEKGYWKTTGKDRHIKHNSKIVGMKKTLVYHSGRAPRGTRTNWVMHEYKLVQDEALHNQGIPADAFVLCRIFQKSGSGPKNGEHYGAPYIEDEWDEDDKEDLLPAGEVVVNELVFLDDSFLETNDLEQNLDICIASEWGPQPSNFCHGESSNYAYLGLDGIDEKPVIGNVDTFEPGNNLFQLHAMEAKPAGGNLDSFETCYNQSAGMNIFEVAPNVEAKSVAGNVETPEPYSVQSAGKTSPHAMEANLEAHNCVGNARKNENPLSFNYSLNELYLDATNDTVAHNSVVGKSFLEANGLANPIEIENPAGIDTLDEFTCSDADCDITQYINFDAFESSEVPYPIESTPGGEQLLQVQTGILDVARKHDRESDVDFDFEGSSSKHTAEEVKFGKGIEYPFFKQASQMLGSVPAPPAFASEFPAKDAALQLQNAAQASSSVHITAGMIRIRNITLKGSGTGLMLGKNGDVDIILPSHLYPSNGNSAAVQLSGLLSGMTAFVASHGWIFLTFFWVLILSATCKIGIFMNTGK